MNFIRHTNNRFKINPWKTRMPTFVGILI